VECNSPTTTITSFDTLNIPLNNNDIASQEIKVTGSRFDAATIIQLRGVDGTIYDVIDFEFTDSTEVKFKIGTLSIAERANRPYKVVVTNGAGLSVTSSTTIGLGSVAWSSPATSSLHKFMVGELKTVTFTAYDATGGSAVTYTLDPGGPLLSGLAIVGNTLTGATNAAGDTGSAVAIRATDNTDPTVFSVRLFSLKAIAELYDFNSHTFTTAGKYGHIGPTITELLSAYSPSWTDNTNYLNVTSTGIQKWTVPITGTYTITARGSGSVTTNQGGTCSNYGYVYSN